VDLDFAAVNPEALITPAQKIWPQCGRALKGRPHVFKALQAVSPPDVRVVIFGNDPYTREEQATGRSFEQGDLKDWAKDIRVDRRVSPSLKTILCAAAATSKANSAYDLMSRLPLDEDEVEWVAHEELSRGLAAGKIKLPNPKRIFDYWSGQGVLWLNRTLTYTLWDQNHRLSHTALWSPFTSRVVDIILEEAKRNRHRVVFALWGTPAKGLRPLIEEKARAVKLPKRLLAFVESGHPQIPKNYFEPGNPLDLINKAIGKSGRPIHWI
jgi:uracil-DNA glycosylase